MRRESLAVIVPSNRPERRQPYLSEVVSTQQYPATILWMESQRLGGTSGFRRNIAMDQAEEEILLHTCDDILPGRGMYGEHMEAHDEFRGDSVAVLGTIQWPLDWKPSVLEQYVMGEGGHQHAYQHIRDPLNCGFRFCYVANISFKADWLKSHEKFDTTIDEYGSDIEWGARLEKQGMVIVYWPMAVGFHDHHFTLRYGVERERKAAKEWVKMGLKNPFWDKPPKPVHIPMYELNERMAELEPKDQHNTITPREIEEVFSMARNQGIEEAQKEFVHA